MRVEGEGGAALRRRTLSAEQENMLENEIILDTDIGTDIDDAFALVYLLKKNARLAGITTVYRNAVRRAKLCKAIMDSMGMKGAEVYAGIDAPFVQEPEKIEPPVCKQHYDEHGTYVPPQCSDEYEKYSISPVSAVSFIVDTCRKNEKTEILAIGALTNIAAAFRIAPDIVGKTRITMMGGCLKKLSLNGEEPHEVAEWNILCDPEAAHIVLSSGAEIRMVGLDVTLDCILEEQVFQRIRNADVCPLLNELVREWAGYYQTKTPVLYDPVAAVSLFADCLVFEDKKLCVGLEGARRGVIYESETGGKTAFAVRRNNEIFYKEFLNVLER